MKVKCELIEPLPAKFAVFVYGDEPKVIGHIVWDFAGEEWVADASLLRCFELLTSDSQLRKGRLGKDLNRAQDIA